MVFRYPPVDRGGEISKETKLAFLKRKGGNKGGNKTLGKSRSGVSSNPSGTKISAFDRRKQERAEAAIRYFDAYQLPSVLIAPLLLPKTTLCEKHFELTLDSTVFVGYPALMKQSSSFSSNSSKKPLVKNCPRFCVNLGYGDETEWKVIEPPFDDQSSDNKGADSSSAATVEESYADDDCEEWWIEKEEKVEVEERDEDEVLCVNVVFAMDSTATEEQKYLYKVISHQLAVALQEEQHRCKYVSQQIALISEAREEWLVEQISADKSSSLSASSSTSSSSSIHMSLTEKILAKSDLAKLIQSVYKQLKEKKNAHATLNNWVRVDLSLHLPLREPSTPCRPYQTLLLYDSKQALLKQINQQINKEAGAWNTFKFLNVQSLPAEITSPNLIRFVQASDPTRSFIELQNVLNIPVAQLYRMASHLSYWSVGMIIDKLTMDKVYIVKSTSVVAKQCSKLSQPFIQKFPAWAALATTLQRFTKPKTLRRHYQSVSVTMQEHFVKVVIWLLRHGLIVQANSYIFIHVPIESSDNEDASLGEEDNKLPGSSRNAANMEVILDDTFFTPERTVPSLTTPSPLELHEISFLERHDDGSAFFALLRRLAPYFRGRHPIPEILWRENVTLSDLTLLLDRFSLFLSISTF